ncbi:MAG: hypothetical protein BWY66_01522 [bacterium ADurb.Bin374]|nr:MAG: hypothetical protein BWY66_01522 [bacterium ADurb.Bin374]
MPPAIPPMTSAVTPTTPVMKPTSLVETASPPFSTASIRNGLDILLTIDSPKRYSRMKPRTTGRCAWEKYSLNAALKGNPSERPSSRRGWGIE